MSSYSRISLTVQCDDKALVKKALDCMQVAYQEKEMSLTLQSWGENYLPSWTLQNQRGVYTLQGYTDIKGRDEFDQIASIYDFQKVLEQTYTMVKLDRAAANQGFVLTENTKAMQRNRQGQVHFEFVQAANSISF